MAARYLEGAGWEVLTRNYRDGPREVDLIIRKGDTVAFVEVKTRSPSDHGHPFEAISRRKQEEVARAARRWLRECPGPIPRNLRFDAVAVFLQRGEEPVVEHLADAWRPGLSG